MFSVEIISIGNELLNGFTINTNASWLGSHLLEKGYLVKWGTTIPDDKEAINSSLDYAKSRADIVLITGGLGPTLDDITKKVVAEYFNSPLELNHKALQNVEAFFARRKREINELGRQQAFLPRGSEALTNTIGTANGIAIFEDNKIFIFMPGVPSEMKSIMENEGFDYIDRYFKSQPFAIKNFKTTGIYESRLAELIDDLISGRNKEISVAFLPRFTGVTLRLMASGENSQALNQFADLVKERIAKYIFSESDEDLEAVVGELLIKKGKTVAVAESCTGGLLSHLLTNVSGSSAYTIYNQVTYSNDAKERFLQVDKQLLEEKGAVCPEVAQAMAEGARQKGGTDFGIGITGIAGPEGGSDEKPVGLVYIALSGEKMDPIIKKYQFGNSRKINKLQSATAALDLLRRVLNDR